MHKNTSLLFLIKWSCKKKKKNLWAHSDTFKMLKKKKSVVRREDIKGLLTEYQLKMEKE